jgi:hypothetical protein
MALRPGRDPEAAVTIEYASTAMSYANTWRMAHSGRWCWGSAARRESSSPPGMIELHDEVDADMRGEHPVEGEQVPMTQPVHGRHFVNCESRLSESS